MSTLRQSRPHRIEARHRILMLKDMPFRDIEGRLAAFSPAKVIHLTPRAIDRGKSMKFAASRSKAEAKFREKVTFPPIESPRSRVDLQHDLDRFLLTCRDLSEAGKVASPRKRFGELRYRNQSL